MMFKNSPKILYETTVVGNSMKNQFVVYSQQQQQKCSIVFIIYSILERNNKLEIIRESKS